MRADIDERNRRVYFRMLEADKLIPCKLEDANKIINHFISNRASMDPASNARKVAQRKEPFHDATHPHLLTKSSLQT